MKTNRRLFPRAVAALFLIASMGDVASAQIRTPRPSPKGSTMQTLGVTDITITYSRPGVKGRTIWGDAPAGAAAGTLDDSRTRAKDAAIVPYGRVWRTGANEATMFAVTDDVMINGQPLKAGTYSLHTIPGRDEWTIIFNSDAGQWGSFAYDEKKDALRVKSKPQAVAENQELLTFSIDPTGESAAKIAIRWEKIVVPFTVEIKDVKALTVEKMRATVAAAKPDDWRTPLQAANYVFLNNLSNTDEAMGWLEKSIKTKETFGNTYTKARVMASQGKNAEAVALGEKALQMAKAPNSGVDAPTIADLEKRMAEWKTKM